MRCAVALLAAVHLLLHSAASQNHMWTDTRHVGLNMSYPAVRERPCGHPSMMLREEGDNTRWLWHVQLVGPMYVETAEISLFVSLDGGEETLMNSIEEIESNEEKPYQLSMRERDKDGGLLREVRTKCQVTDTLVHCASPTQMRLERDPNDASASFLVVYILVNPNCNINNYRLFHGQIPGDRSHGAPDEFVFSRLFRYPQPKRNGVYLEMGAVDGIYISNTLFFEAQLGWTGVLIEPEPVAAYRLLRNRGRHNVCLPIAICKTKGASSGGGGGGGVEGGDGEGDGVESVTFKGHPGATAAGLVHALPSFTPFLPAVAPTFEVPCAPLGATLREIGITHIDFWSLDVEGSELIVLETMDWNITVCAILVEQDDINEEKDEQVRGVLSSVGMVPLGVLGDNELWFNRAHCSSPPSYINGN